MTNSIIDLHLHTFFSDGCASPAELLNAAVNLGLKVVSITDHDNLNAYPEARHIAARLGLDLIPGIELTSHWILPDGSGLAPLNGRDVDVLGYYVDAQNEDLNIFTQSALLDLRERMIDACALLTQAGYPISIFDVQDENPRYTGARQLIEALGHKGFGASWNECLALFDSVWPKVRLSCSSIEEVIKIIHQAGGVAVLAHPIAVECTAGWLQSGHIELLTRFGLDGLEVNHPRLDPTARAHFLGLVREFDLIISGGSDEHGGNGLFPRLGSEIIRYEILNSLQARTQRYIDKSSHKSEALSI